MDLKNIKLQNVTTIFPSITFAAWASIFTGKTPNETGIVGNEFFARDIYKGTAPNLIIPGMTAAGIPFGVVSLDADGGAFYPGGREFALAHVTPAEYWPYSNDTLSKKLYASAPSKSLLNDPLWSAIGNIVKSGYKISSDQRCDSSGNECRTVAIFNQYAKGADWWGTASLSSFAAGVSYPDVAKIMDKAAANETASFISNYFSQSNSEGRRKRFPAVLSVYLAGLDHDAHVEGMGVYAEYFKGTTDAQAKEIVNALKAQDEFENKIFIIVADHGHTPMPTNLTYPTSVDEVEVDGMVKLPPTTGILSAEMSCELKLEGFNKSENQLPERANNNLHIWELATLFQQFDSAEGLRLLVPIEIEQTIIAGLKQGEISAVTSDINQANVIVAFNGPMSHVYVKAGGGWSEPNNDAVMLAGVADKLTLYFCENGIGLRRTKKELFPRLLASIDKILLRVDGNYRLFKGVTTNENGTINGLAPLGGLNELESNQDNVSAAIRLERMNSPMRSGDIVLLMKDGSGDSVETRYTTGVACKSCGICQ